MKGFSKVVAPITAPWTAPLKGKCDFIIWTCKCDLSFFTLKSVIIHAPILTIIDHLKENI